MSSTPSMPLLGDSTSVTQPLTYSPALDKTVRLLILFVVTLVTSMEFLTSYAIGVALPDIGGDLSASFDEASWIITTYMTCFLIGLMLSNWLSDRIGYRRHMILAVTLFMCSSAACGFSHTLTQMLICRGFMGFGGSNFLVRGQTAIYRSYARGKARFVALFVYVIGVVVFARTFAPAVGGYLTEWYSWRYIFFLNVPLSLAALVILIGYLPDVRAKIEHPHLDVPGLLLLIGWVAPLQIVLSRGERDDWFSDPFICALSLTAACCFPAFIWWERHPANISPIMSLTPYRSRNFAFGSIYVVILGMMLYGQLYFVPQFLRFVQHHSAEGTGNLQTVDAAAFTVGLITGAFIMRRIGFRVALAVGAVIFAAGMWCWTTRLTPTISDTEMFLPLILTGFGAGWQIGPISTLINSEIPSILLGESMQLYLFQRQIGGSWNIAFLTILVDRQRSFWSSRLGENITEYNLAAQDAIRQGTGALQLKGFPQAQAEAGAAQLVHLRLLLQSIVNAFQDTFFYQSLIGLAALCLLLFFAKGHVIKDMARWFVTLVR
ncbi:MAG TPA: DHA2 family efflux MFS transporter permease subunit [Phycisphaerae bacterium]|nr:DHA2 family efflux MFS transporter permease subunit [Phycisphaerae bacterium]